MSEKELNQLRLFFLIMIGVVVLFFATACTVQWAFKNKNTDCGFTNDKIGPSGKREPMIFYGDPKSNK